MGPAKGIGISSGDLLNVILGAAGERLEHLVFGDPFETAERLESASRRGSATRIVCSSEIRDSRSDLEFIALPEEAAAGDPAVWELAHLPPDCRPPERRPPASSSSPIAGAGT